MTIAIVWAEVEPLHNRIDDHIPRASIKGNHLRRWGARGDCRQVGNSADVLHHAAHPQIAIKQVVKKWNQRSAFAANRHVRGAKIGYYGSADSGRNHGAFAGLPSHGYLATKESLWLALMVERLPVATDQIQFHAGPALSCEHGVSIE